MSAVLESLRAARSSPHAQAFLDLIRWCEGTGDANGYRRLFGGDLVGELPDHPRRAVTRRLAGEPITSTAAGAYQFLARTWDDVARALALPDFSPDSQDLAALFLIHRRGALPDVLAGRWEAAINKCNHEWASLPGSPYGQPTKRMAGCLAFLARRVPAAVTEPVPAPNAPATEPEEQTMPIPAIVGAVLPTIIQHAPDLVSIFADKGQSARERNVAAATKVLEIAKEVTGAGNEQGAAEAMASDPQAAKAFRDTVRERWFEIVEAGGGGIDGARKYSAEMASTPMWQQPAFWISVLLLVPVYAVVGAVLFGDGWTNEIRIQVVTAVLAVIGIVGAFWLGSSMSSQRKDEARFAAERGGR